MIKQGFSHQWIRLGENCSPRRTKIKATFHLHGYIRKLFINCISSKYWTFINHILHSVDFSHRAVSSSRWFCFPLQVHYFNTSNELCTRRHLNDLYISYPEDPTTREMRLDKEKSCLETYEDDNTWECKLTVSSSNVDANPSEDTICKRTKAGLTCAYLRSCQSLIMWQTVVLLFCTCIR